MKDRYTLGRFLVAMAIATVISLVMLLALAGPVSQPIPSGSVTVPTAGEPVPFEANP